MAAQVRAGLRIRAGGHSFRPVVNRGADAELVAGRDQHVTRPTTGAVEGVARHVVAGSAHGRHSCTGVGIGRFVEGHAGARRDMGHVLGVGAFPFDSLGSLAVSRNWRITVAAAAGAAGNTIAKEVGNRPSGIDEGISRIAMVVGMAGVAGIERLIIRAVGVNFNSRVTVFAGRVSREPVTSDPGEGVVVGRRLEHMAVFTAIGRAAGMRATAEVRYPGIEATGHITVAAFAGAGVSGVVV